MHRQLLPIARAAALAAVLLGLGPSASGAEPDGSEALQVLVGPSGSGLEPMAIPDVHCAEKTPKRVCAMVAEVLRRNMTISFMYAVIPPRSYLANPEVDTLESPAFNDWTNIGARWLIKASITGEGPFNAELRLYNVVERGPLRVREQSFEGVGEAALRKSVHRFCNGVLEARTGTPGVFDTRIAYSVKAGLGVKSIGAVSMDGIEKTGLISNGDANTLPAWGFGGILYTSFLSGKPDIYFGKKKLSRDTGHYRKVAVSPDGSKMVASISYGGQSDLYLMSPDGQVLKNLTNTEADEVAPTFSPDGTKVAFLSSAAGSPQIFMMNVAGGGMTRLTHAGGYNYSPDWGKNGLIAFTAMDGATSDIFTVNEAGEIRRLTQNQGFNKDPSWSRDGRYIAFVSNRAEGSGIWIMSADGRYQVLVTRGGGMGNTAWER